MANRYTYQALVDNSKRALIKLTGVLDTEMANVVAIDVSSLALALNATGQIMTSNTNPKSAYNVSIRRVFGDINANQLRLQWHGTSNTDILVLSPRMFNIDLDRDGINSLIKNETAGTNGDILISTLGVTPTSNSSYTLFIDVRKDNRDYDAGQSADPAAFNSGPYSR